MREQNSATCIVVFCDGLFDRSFDLDESDKANNYFKYCQKNYRGNYTKEQMTDNEFKKLMGVTKNIIENKELARAVGELKRR